MTQTAHPHFTTAFDPQLDQIPMYGRFPIMKPSVGVHYGVDGPRILIIGESHYLPKGSTIHLDADTWYQEDQKALKEIDGERECDWVNTRGILKKKRGYWKRGHAIYRNLENALHQAGVPESPNAFQYVAFMNAFQRPARTGDSIKATTQDIAVAQETLSHVIRVIEPDHVVIVSSKARDLVGKKLDVSFSSTPHPACPHWNNPKQRKGPGKAQFVGHIERYYQNQ